VISPVAMQLLMEAAGLESVAVGDSVLQVRDLVDFFAYGQYADNDDTQERRSSIAPVAAEALRALFDTDVDTKNLVNALFGSFDGRALFLWSRDPETQLLWERAQASGEAPDNSIKVAVLNAGGNKLDRFLDVAVGVAVDGNMVELDVTVDNTAIGDEHSYVLGARNPGVYTGHLVVSVPSGAIGVETSGDEPLNASAPDGPSSHSYVFIVQLEAGQSTAQRVVIEMPTSVSEVFIEPSGRFPEIEWTVNGSPRADTRSSFPINQD
jgi:hypothetical protein